MNQQVEWRHEDARSREIRRRAIGPRAVGCRVASEVVKLLRVGSGDEGDLTSTPPLKNRTCAL